MVFILRRQFEQYLQNRVHRSQLLAMNERDRNDLAISRIDAEQLAGRFPVIHNAWRQGEDDGQ